MQLFSTEPESHHEVSRALESRYDHLISSGQKQPFVYPLVSYGAFLAIVYLCIDHRRRPWLQHCRFIVWGALLVCSAWCISNTRARNPAAAFGVGIVSSWAALWSSVMLVFNDGQTDFKRIERIARAREENPSESVEGQEGGRSQDVDLAANGHVGVKHRRPVTKYNHPGIEHSEYGGILIWQGYPDGPLYTRFDWICDLFSSFRGMGWNYRISGLPPPLEPIQGDPATNTEQYHANRRDFRQFRSKRDLLRHNLKLLVRNYFILDVLKTLISHDPYFWTGSYSRRPGYLSTWLDDYTVIDQSCRLLISLAAVFIALQTIFALGPVFFVGVLGDRYIGVRGEPWLYCDQFGSFSKVLDKGLAGWWGGWWHQTFRYGFEAPSTRIVDMLGWSQKSTKAKFLKLCVAFSLSGCLHACGSYTQIGETRPLRGPLLFFVLQILGISFQLFATSLLAKMGVRDSSPRWLRRTINVVYVHVWLYHTAPLLVDDFAKGGIWLFEPVPVSVLRGLGFGGKGDGWFPLTGAFSDRAVLRWHRGDSWWNTGVAL